MNLRVTHAPQAQEAALPDWPQGGLERVETCPVCASTARSLLHDDLRDRIFFAAPGTWSMWRCADCESAYLDPRPSRETIGLAYRDYYTHKPAGGQEPGSIFQRIKAGMRDAYLHRRFGAGLREGGLAAAIGRLMLPLIRIEADLVFRYLPRAHAGEKRKILDIGCGNGEWLAKIRPVGWQLCGAEPDPAAAEAAQQLGMEVRQGSSEAWLDQAGSFDFVALSHVIEHLHDPGETLRTIHQLLKPGGTLFIDTPNVDAAGHRRYGAHWRGLEPPRHLALFNRRSLLRAVSEAGFESARYRTRIQPAKFLDQQSERIAQGLDPYGAQGLVKTPSIWRRLRAQLARRNAEFLTVTCRKPL